MAEPLINVSASTSTSEVAGGSRILYDAVVLAQVGEFSSTAFNLTLFDDQLTSTD